MSERPVVDRPSPKLAINDRGTRYQTRREPVMVWVENFPPLEPVEPGWYTGELVEWTHHEVHGRTGRVRFSTGPAERFSGWFDPAAIRLLEETSVDEQLETVLDELLPKYGDAFRRLRDT